MCFGNDIICIISRINTLLLIIFSFHYFVNKNQKPKSKITNHVFQKIKIYCKIKNQKPKSEIQKLKLKTKNQNPKTKNQTNNITKSFLILLGLC